MNIFEENVGRTCTHFCYFKRDRMEKLGCLEICTFEEDNKLCIVTVLKEYVTCTKLTRGSSTQLFLSYCKPFKPVSTDTIAPWLKKVLANAGININKYGAHSTRAASTSAAKATNV